MKKYKPSFNKPSSNHSQKDDQGVKAKKHLGQHFLTDENIAAKIADTLSFSGYEKVLEIGPGMGVLTKYLLEKDTEVHVIEIDTESVEYLESHYLHLRDRIHEKDFLKHDLGQIFKAEQFAVIGNFPYNISTQIVFKVLQMRDQIPEFSGMFQKEVADRLTAAPGSKAYGRLSVVTQWLCEARHDFNVSNTAFTPPPKVASSVVTLFPRPEPLALASWPALEAVTAAAFGQRRKMLRASLRKLGLNPAALGIDPTARAEDLDVEEFCVLARAYAEIC